MSYPSIFRFLGALVLPSDCWAHYVGQELGWDNFLLPRLNRSIFNSLLVQETSYTNIENNGVLSLKSRHKGRLEEVDLGDFCGR